MSYPIVYFASIPNTGTNSLIRMLKECVGHDNVAGFHITVGKPIQDVEAKMALGPHVFPIRHPADVGFSNANRRWKWQTPAFDRYHQLAISEHDTHFVRIDCPVAERDEELRKLCEWLGCPVPESFDWPHENRGEHWMTMGRKDLLHRVISDISAPAREWLKGYGYDLRAEWEAA